MLEIRLRNRIADVELDQKIGKIITEDDVNCVITNDARVYTPDGNLLLVFRRNAISTRVLDDSYAVLHSLKTHKTCNRGLASGTPRVKIGDQKRTRTRPVSSAVIGAVDPMGQQPYCRLTAWTGEEMDQYESLFPLFREVADVFKANVPDRYAVQQGFAEKTKPEWVIGGTPFTTITVNNTYPTGVHTDKGDLDEGFSCLTVVTRGTYDGGWLCFPRYRVGVDIQHGDVILMNAHEWHGNTMIRPLHTCPDVATPDEQSEPYPGCVGCAAERISVVCYYRTEIIKCGDADKEEQKAKRYSDRKAGYYQNAELPV